MFILKKCFSDFSDYVHFREELASFIRSFVPGKFTLVEIALNEAINNAFKHGSPHDVMLKIKVHPGKRIIFRIRDQGKGFPGNEKLHNLSRNMFQKPDLKDCGRGLYIIFRVFDYVKFNRSGQEVLLVKQLNESKGELTNETDWELDDDQENYRISHFRGTVQRRIVDSDRLQGQLSAD